MNLCSKLKGKTATGITVQAGGFVLAGADIVLVSRNLSALEEAVTLICPVTHEIPQKESRN